MNAHSQDPQSAGNSDLEQRVTTLETRVDAAKKDRSDSATRFEVLRGDLRAQAEKDRGDIATRFEAQRSDLRMQREAFCGHMRKQIEQDRRVVAIQFEAMRGDLRVQSDEFRKEMRTQYEEFRVEIIGIIVNALADLDEWGNKVMMIWLLGLLGVCCAMFIALETLIDMRVPPPATVEYGRTVSPAPPPGLRPR